MGGDLGKIKDVGGQVALAVAAPNKHEWKVLGFILKKVQKMECQCVLKWNRRWIKLLPSHRTWLFGNDCFAQSRAVRRVRN